MIAQRLCALCMRCTVAALDNNGKKFYSTASRLTNAEVRKKRSALFEEEKQRQRRDFVKRIEKVEVVVIGPQDSKEILVMNKYISTPYNCAMHIGEYEMKRSIVALVNGEPWDMHRPIEDNSHLEFKNMLDENPTLPNKVFWRSGAFVLGHILETAFKEDIYVELCTFPPTPLEAGCFVYDVDLKLPNWKPSQRELQCLSIVGGRLNTKDWEFERLDVDVGVALKMFEDNRFKSVQIPEIAEKSAHNRVVLYRMGDHVDICKGPLISNSSQMFRFSVSAVHQIESNKYGTLRRVQAIALPADLRMHWWSWDLLCKRAAKPMMKYMPDYEYKQQKQVEQRVEDILEKL